jgi:uncharacterized protein (TIGR00299 family) protein
MAQVMYFDCSSGAAGDMILAALIDAGLPAGALRSALGSLGVDHQVVISKVLRAGIAATHFDVRPVAAAAGSSTGTAAVHAHPHSAGGGHDHGHADDSPHRSLEEIVALIGRAELSASARERAIAMFRRIAAAEAAIHDTPIDRVHLHEVGAVDSIIDIVGAAFAMEWFGIDEVVASPLNVGAGTVTMSHGTFPVPAPATLRLLTGVPIYSGDVKAELVTPTGALVVSTYARSYGALPPMRVNRIGYGAGTRDLGKTPNVLRVVIGERAETAAPPAGTVVQIECEIDDMNPQLYGPVMDRLFAAGALDVFLTPVQMKKNRPGTLLTALAPPDRRDAVCDVIFRETTTIGVRFAEVQRETLERRTETVELRGGSVRMKIASRRGAIVNAIAEFDDCLRVAEATGQPIKQVQADALRAWLDRDSP